MASNVTTNDVVPTNGLNQSFLLNQYVHDKIRVPLEKLFRQEEPMITDKKPQRVLDTEKSNLQANRSGIGNIWSTKVQPILDQIMLLSESTKQKTVGFIGEAGSGKSSLINSILDYDLLPTDDADTCTASISAISFWKEPYYQMFIYFISKEQWQLESDDTRETLNIHKNDENELPDEVKAFRLKQKYLFNSNDINETPLDDLPEDIKKKMSKGYEIYNTDSLDSVKKQLNNFAARDGQFWPIVDRIYIRGPFTKLSSDLMLLDIPGYGDGYEAMTIRAVEATAACDQLVHVVRGDTRTLLTPNFLKSLLRSSTSLKHISLVVTHRNTAIPAKKQKGDNETIEGQCKERLKEKARDISSNNFPIEYVNRFIDNLPVYYIENRCAREDWSEADQTFLNSFVNKELNNIIATELDKTRYDIITNINILLKFLSTELAQPLCKVILNEELSPLTKECLMAFTTKLERLELLFKDESKRLWDEHFWPVIEKTTHNVSPHNYEDMNYQTLRKNLNGNYIRIADGLARNMIDISKVESVSTVDVLFTNIVRIDELSVVFRDKLLLPLKEILNKKNAEAMFTTVDQLDNKIKYHIQRWKTVLDSNLQSIGRQIQYSMYRPMQDEIQNRLWTGDGLRYVSGQGTKNRYLTSLQKFITELNSNNSNFSEKLYKYLSPYFSDLSDTFIRFTEDIKTTVSDMTFSFVLDDALKQKVLEVLVPLPLKFTQAAIDSTDQPTQSDPEFKDYSLSDFTELQITEQYSSLSDIHKYNPEILTPIPKVYTNISTNYVYFGEVYVFSNKDMPNLYKIGYTTIGTEKRAKQLYGTGVPSRFIIENIFKCYNCKVFEQWMHKLFIKHRINTSREFFRVPLQIIIEVGKKLEAIMNKMFGNT